MAIGAGISGQWFIVATPTGSNATTFHNVITGSGWSSSFTAFNPATPTPAAWGTLNNYPTNSAFLPTAFVRNIPSNYPAGFYDYTNPNTGGTVQTKPQNIQLVAYPFQNTGSFRGDFVGSGSVIGGVDANGTMALNDPSLLVNPVTYAAVKSMSFSDRDIAGVLQTSTYADIKPGDRILLRNLTENEIATYEVLSSRDTTLGLGATAFSVNLLTGTGNPIIGSDIFIDFVRTGSQQKMFIVAGAANPNGSQRFADQFSTGSVGASGDFRSGIIKFYATESNIEADWDYLVKQLVGLDGATTIPTTLASQYNLFMFTGSAGVSSSYYLITTDTA